MLLIILLHRRLLVVNKQHQSVVLLFYKMTFDEAAPNTDKQNHTEYPESEL